MNDKTSLSHKGVIRRYCYIEYGNTGKWRKVYLAHFLFTDRSQYVKLIEGGK